MAAKTGITSIKRFTYRGDSTEEWSNQYWFKGAPPANQAAWQDVAGQIAAAERSCFGPATSVVAFYGYDNNADNANAVFDWNETNGFVPYPGTHTMLGTAMAGDQAGMVEWKTTSKNTRGKWIYLRKYLHGGDVTPSASDTITTALHAAYQTFGTYISSFHGGLTARVNDYVIESVLPSTYVTTRTLKRRGKRPLAP